MHFPTFQFFTLLPLSHSQLDSCNIYHLIKCTHSFKARKLNVILICVYYEAIREEISSNSSCFYGIINS